MEANQAGNLKRLRNLMRSGPSNPRRNKLMPGESLADYQRVLYQSGLSEPEFEWTRLVKNGWSLDDEIRYRESARIIGMNLYRITIKDEKGIRRDVGVDLVSEGERLMREGKFPGQKIIQKTIDREPGSDDHL